MHSAMNSKLLWFRGCPRPAYTHDSKLPAFRKTRFDFLQPQEAVFSETGANIQGNDSRNLSAPEFRIEQECCDQKNAHSSIFRRTFSSAFCARAGLESTGIPSSRQGI